MFEKFWDTTSLIRRLYDKEMQPVCEHYQITRIELDILLFLANNPSFDTARDIIERKKLTKSHVSASVKKMTERGLLEQSYHPENRKNIHLKVKGEAQEMIEKGREAQKAFGVVLTRNFSMEEIQSLRDSFEKISDNIRAALEEEIYR